jgi:hypothetical protein
MGIAYRAVNTHTHTHKKKAYVRGLAESISWTYSYLAGHRDANVSPKAICSVTKS